MLALAVAVLPLASYAPAPRCASPAAANSRAAVAPLRAAPLRMAETAVVTDGTDSFFGSRTIFQVLHDHGDFSRLTAFSSSTVDAKKMLISRQARYSGLIDNLDFAEGGDAELATAFDGKSTWVAINADEAALPAQIKAASAAGVKRVFLHLSAADAAPGGMDAVKSALDASGATWTVMRTGSLAKSGAGGGLIVGDIDQPTCDEVPLDDAFRFIVEALALPEAEGRIFSLCPSEDATQLKQMRMAGCTPKEETEALLKGVIVEKSGEAAAEASAAAAGEAEEEDPRSEEEKKAAAEEEVKMLLERARTKGIENQKRMAAEEKEKAEKRAERLAYFASMQPDEEDEKKEGDEGDAPPKDGDEGGDDDKGGDGDGGDGGDKKGDDDDDKKGDDDDDRLQAA